MKAIKDLSEEDLDELVHNLASNIASQVNNQGVEGQLKFLRDVGGMTDEQILAGVDNG